MKKQAVSKTHSLLITSYKIITSYKSLFTRHGPDGRRQRR